MRVGAARDDEDVRAGRDVVHHVAALGLCTYKKPQRGNKRNRSHTQQHDQNNTTNKQPHEQIPPPHTQQRSKVARRLCVPPPTPGWVNSKTTTRSRKGQAGCIYNNAFDRLGRSGPNLEPGTVVICVINGSRNGLNMERKVGLCPETSG